MLKTFLTCLTIVYSAHLFGQELSYNDVVWEESPVWESLDSAYSEEQEVGLIYKRIVEFAYSEEYDNRLVEYFTIHRKVRVVSDDAVQANNKVYIGMRDVLDLVEAKARVITPDGEIITFDESNMNDSEGEDGSVVYKYFAIDGAVNGSDIEYTYTVMRVPSYEGDRMTFQSENIRTNVDFTLCSPSNLLFDFKSYNNFPEMILDTLEEDKNLYYAKIDSIGAMVDENYSAYRKNLMYLVYKLDENTGTRTSNIVTFGEVSQNIYNFYYSEPEKKDLKALKKLITESGAFKEENSEKQIRLVESYIKTNIGLIDGVPTKGFSELISDGYTSARGMTYITIQAMKMLDIKHEIVLTCNRYDDLFDKDFEHYDVLENLFLYFPKQKLYLAPDEELFRLGLIPDDWTGQNGLFIKEISAGDMHTGLGKVKYIKGLDADLTHDYMDVTVDFSDITQPEIDFERELLGYSNVYFQSVYNLIEEEGQKELDESLIMFADENGEVIEYTVTGTDEADFGVNPMIYKGKMKTTSIMEKAGNRYLFKVGELIGPQMEMYQDEERVTDIEHRHNMEYKRVIRFEIPEGFELSGLEALEINETYPIDNPTIRFVSSYTTKGNMVEITVIERYDEILFEKEEITDFRRIINAAANFNKIVLFLVKK